VKTEERKLMGRRVTKTCFFVPPRIFVVSAFGRADGRHYLAEEKTWAGPL